MNIMQFPSSLSAVGQELDCAPDCLGALRDSGDVAGDTDALRERMASDGYLYLPGALDRDQVLKARRAITDALAAKGVTNPDYLSEDAVARTAQPVGMMADYASECAPLQQVLYAGQMMQFWERFLGGPVRHFDYTWLRAVAPGISSAPHCDIVFMGRGTSHLFTAWTPLGDISLEMGGLMILENSHLNASVKASYGRKDVDVYCANRPAVETQRFGGAISTNARALRDEMGGRWLTANFRAGDLLAFGMYTIHTGLDNRSDRIRISCDSRYQLASEPADERWIGANPIGHGPNAKRGMIC